MLQKSVLNRLAISLSLMSISHPAISQSAGSTPSNQSGTPPAQQLAITPTGVDMRTQRYVYSKTDISAGSTSANTYLNLTRSTFVNSSGEGTFGSFDTDFRITMYEKRINVNGRNFDHGTGSDYRVTVVIGGISDTFQMLSTNSGFENIGANKESQLSIVGDINSSLSYYKYISSDGTEYNFRKNDSKDCSAIMRCSYVDNINYANGTILSIEYANPSGIIGRAIIRKIQSNFGYNIIFEHGLPNKNVVTKACLVNTAVTYHAAYSCPNNPAAAVDYSYSTTNSGRLVLTAVTAGSVKLEGFSYKETQAGLSYPVEMSFFSGKNDKAYLVNHISLFANDDPSDGSREIIEKQQFADGSSIVFNYTHASDYTNESIKSIVGETYTKIVGENTLWSKEVQFGFIVLPRSLWKNNSSGNEVEENVGDAPFQLTPGPIRIVDALESGPIDLR